MHSLSKIR